MAHDFWQALDTMLQTSPIVIDRPQGSRHPRYDDVYPLDYGFLDGTNGGDGSGIDVWRGASGEKRLVGVILTADLLKRDTEIKLLLGCTPQEIETVLAFTRKSMGCIVVHRETV